MSRYTTEQARELLTQAEVFFDNEDGDIPQVLNMNDTWAWACADGEHVPNDCLPAVAELFLAYGRCGILYWVSERHGGLQSEFHDINRFIQFVRKEEEIKKRIPDSSKRAYTKIKYMMGRWF